MSVEAELHPEAAPTARPLASRVAATFTAPAKLARWLRERPRWLDVLLISTAIAIAAAAMLPAEFFLAAAEDAVTRRGAPVEITSPPGEIVRWGRYLAMLNALVGHPLIAFALAGLLTLIFTVLAGGRAPFNEHLALTSHALLILALGTLVDLLVRLVTGSAEPGSSLALIPAPGAIREVLSLINPFTVWMLVVLAVGVSELDPGRSRRSGLGVLLGAYLALVLALALAA